MSSKKAKKNVNSTFGHLPSVLSEQGRRKVRYWCFRFRTEADGGAPATEAPPGIREHFEGLDWFKGWKLFGIEWDVHEVDYGRMVPLKENPLTMWDAEAYKSARTLPNKAD